MIRKLLPITALLALAGCGDPSSTPANDQTAATPAPESAPLPIKETGKAKGVDFTVTKVATSSQIGPAGIGVTAGEGETFVVVDYTLKNTSEAPLPLMERPGIKLVDAKGQAYAMDDMAGGMSAAMMDDPTGMGADLNPNTSAKSKAAWRVEKAAFDKDTWRVVVGSDPQLTFALK